MTILPLPLATIVNAIERGRALTMGRYGDGEFQAILRAGTENCDHVIYTDALADALADTLINAREYIHAIGPKASANKELAAAVSAWLAQHAPTLVWWDSESMLNASLAGKLYPFIHALSMRRVMLVGPAHLRQLPETFSPRVHVEVPATSAFERIRGLEHIVCTHASKVDVILFAAGPAAKVMIHDLYPLLGTDHALIDIGSVMDIYANVNSRRYARTMDIDRKQELTLANFYNNGKS